MPAGALIGAAGSVASGVASGKGASKAAQIQAQTAQQQMQLAQNMYNSNVARATPTMDNGTAAQTQLQSLLGLSGNPTSAEATLAATPGYQFAKQQGLDSINANAYASGQGNSGAALKSAMQYATGLADQNYNNYAAQLGSVADRGVSAMNGIIGAGNTLTSQQLGVTQNAANASSGNAAYQGTNIANMLKGLTQSATQAFGSSYSPTVAPTVTPSVGILNYDPLATHASTVPYTLGRI